MELKRDHPSNLSSTPNFIPIQIIVFETSQSKPQISTSWFHNRKHQTITKVMRILPLGTMNVWTEFHGNPSSGCYISVWIKVVDQQTDRHWQDYSHTNKHLPKAFAIAMLSNRPMKGVGARSSLLVTSSLYFLVGELLCPPQSLSDVSFTAGSLGNQCRATSASAEATTHCHHPIGGRERHQVLRQENTVPVTGES